MPRPRGKTLRSTAASSALSNSVRISTLAGMAAQFIVVPPAAFTRVRLGILRSAGPEHIRGIQLFDDSCPGSKGAHTSERKRGIHAARP